MTLATLTARAACQSWSVPFNHNEYCNGNDRYTHPYSPWSSIALNPSQAPAPNWSQQPVQPALQFAPITNIDVSGGLVFAPGYTWPQPAAPGGLDAAILNYDETYEIHCDRLPIGHAVSRVVLTAPCSVTHHSDMHQRYVELASVVRNGNEVTFKLSFDERQAPRGLYMLWLVTNMGTPSVARWVVLR